jgi:hypothetical protein
MPASDDPEAQHIEILPLEVVARAFPARPSALPDVRDFVRRQLTTASMSDEDVRALCDRVAEVLLDAAGSAGTIQVSLRTFARSAEVDVLFAREGEATAGRLIAPDRDRAARTGEAARIGEQRRPPAPPADPAPPSAAEPAPPFAEPAPSFAVWLSGRLRAEGMTMEGAARRLDVSTKTVSRWVAGTTEPRLRDLYRIRDVFGEPPFQ